MKIGFFGNTNNYPFMLARTFRRMGHEVVFFVNKDEKLHRPEFRYGDVKYPYPDWIKSSALREAQDFVSSKFRNEIIDSLNTCDFVVLNDWGISLGKDLRCKRMSLCTGSDLEQYCNPKTAELASNSINNFPVFIKRWRSRSVWNRLINAQRESIKTSDLVYYFSPGIMPSGDEILRDLGIDSSRRIFFLQADVESISPTRLPNHKPLRTFCAARFVWKYPVMPGFTENDYKGSDVMIQGISLFLKNHNYPLDLHFVRKGQHVEDAEVLMKELGVEPFVTWHSELTQREVWEQYTQADFCFDQFGKSFVAMAGLEAMASGRPLIADARPEIFDSVWKTPSPICHARTPEQICTQIEKLAFNPELREELGRASREFVVVNCSPISAANSILERLFPNN